MQVFADELYVCADCIQVIANDDWTWFDGSAAEFERRHAEIDAGIGQFDTPEIRRYWVPGDDYLESSRWSCDCCGSSLPGARYECAVLEHEPKEEEKRP